MPTIEIYKDRNDNYYVQAGDYKVRIADGTRHDGTTIGHFELVNLSSNETESNKQNSSIATYTENSKPEDYA